MTVDYIWKLNLQVRVITYLFIYRSGQANSNTVNSKFHLIQSLVQISVHFPIFSMLNWMVNSNRVNLKFHVIQTFQHKPTSK